MSSKEQKTPEGQAPEKIIMDQHEEIEAVEPEASAEQVDPRDEKIANLEAQLAEAQTRERDGILRVKAEMENLRRRTELDVEKAHKFALEKFVNELLPVLDKLTALKPNRMEAELLSGVTIRDEADVQKAAKVLLDKGVQQVYISLGSDGLYAEDQAGRHVRLPCPKVQVVNATGGGDAMAAALAACIAHGKPLAECARKAAGAGALACTAAETIHPGMSWENVDYILDNTGMSKKA